MMLKKLPIIVVTSLGFLFASPAAAQNEPIFRGVDGFVFSADGSLTQLGPRDRVEALVPGTREIPDLISAFRHYCLRARFMPQMIGFIDFPGEFDLDARWVIVNEGTDTAFEIAGWHGGDVSLIILDTPHHSPGRQCSVTAATTVNHPAQELFPAMITVFGQPLNVDEIFNEDGSQNPGIRPVWLATDEIEGGPVLAFARSLSSGRGGYRTHLVMIQTAGN